MKPDARSALTLHKVNLELCFRLCDMFRHHGLRWSEARNHMLDVCASELEEVSSRMLDNDDWMATGFVSGDLGWKTLQHQSLFLHHFARIAVASHADLLCQAQDAIAAWQKACVGALEARADMPGFRAALQELFDMTRQCWALPAPTEPPPLPAAGRKAARPRAGG